MSRAALRGPSPKAQRSPIAAAGDAAPDLILGIERAKVDRPASKDLPLAFICEHCESSTHSRFIETAIRRRRRSSRRSGTCAARAPARLLSGTRRRTVEWRALRKEEETPTLRASVFPERGRAVERASGELARLSSGRVIWVRNEVK